MFKIPVSCKVLIINGINTSKYRTISSPQIAESLPKVSRTSDTTPLCRLDRDVNPLPPIKVIQGLFGLFKVLINH